MNRRKFILSTAFGIGAITVPLSAKSKPDVEELMKKELIERMSDYPCVVNVPFYVHEPYSKSWTITTSTTTQPTEWIHYDQMQ